MLKNEEDLLLNRELLEELKVVSAKSCQSRFQHDEFDTMQRYNSSLNENQPSFLESTPENAELNQYWYSKATTEVLCKAIMEKMQGDRGKVAFLSTPSLYFALPLEYRANCFIFDVR